MTDKAMLVRILKKNTTCCLKLFIFVNYINTSTNASPISQDKCVYTAYYLLPYQIYPKPFNRYKAEQ